MLHPYSEIDQLFEEFLTVSTTELTESTKKAHSRLYFFFSSTGAGMLPIAEFTSNDYDRIVSILRNQLSEIRFCRVTSLVSKMFDYAISLHLIHRNPCYAVKYEHPLWYTGKIYSEDEMLNIIKAISRTPLANLYALALCTGMRTGELLAITREKILDDGKKLLIDQHMINNHRKNHFEISTNMHRYGLPRTIELPHVAQTVIKRQLKRVDNQGASTNLVFLDELNRNYTLGEIAKYDKQVKDNTNLPFNISLLRTNFCINALKRGLNHKMLQNYVGEVMPNHILHLFFGTGGYEQRNLASATNDFYSSLEVLSHE